MTIELPKATHGALRDLGLLWGMTPEDIVLGWVQRNLNATSLFAPHYRETDQLGGSGSAVDLRRNAFDLEERLSDLSYRWGMHPSDLKDGLLNEQLGSIEGHFADPDNEDDDEPMRLRMVKAAGRN